jgi:hypothetical protein
MKKILYLFLLFISLTVSVFSQEDLLAGEVDPPDPGGLVPVDGGLSLLLAAGVAYGVSRRRKRD